MSIFPTGGIFKQGDFQIDPNATPEMIRAKREALAAMMPRYGQAKYIGEGIGQLGTAIASNRQHKAYDKFEGERRGDAARQYNDVLSRQSARAQGGPMSVLGMSQPEARNPADAKYPTGQEGTAPQGNVDPASGLDMGAGAYPAIPQVDEMSSYIMEAAKARGIDPKTALAVARSEGLNADPSDGWQSRVVKNGQRERSYGPFQLYVDGGLGNSFMDDTGLDPRDPTTWQAQIDYSLDHASKNGWGAWYGAKNTGIGNMQGIGGAPSGGGSFAPGQGTRVAQSGGAYGQPTGGTDVNDLLMLAQNPWLSSEQRQVINSQIQQRQAQAQMAQERAYEREDFLWKQQNSTAPAEYGLTPQYVTQPDGTLQMVQVSKNGGPAKVVDLPPGAALQKGVQKLDLGTTFQWFNTITGEPIGDPIPKNNREAAAETAAGSAEGQAQVEAGSELREMQRNMPGLLEVVGQLEILADEATYTFAGRAYDEARKQAGMDPSDGAVARAEYIAVVDNQVLPLLRQTFGAAFTAKEGETLRATLGDPNKSPQEKKAVLNAFIAQKKRDLESRGGTVPTGDDEGWTEVDGVKIRVKK